MIQEHIKHGDYDEGSCSISSYLPHFISLDDRERITGDTLTDFAISRRRMGRLRLRWVRELDDLPFSLLEGCGGILDNELGSDGSHGQIGDGGAPISSLRLASVFFHFSDEDAGRLEVDFPWMNPDKVLFILLSLWTICMGGADGCAVHIGGLRDITGSESIGPLRGLDFLALLCPWLIACGDFILIIPEIYHNEATTQLLLLRKGGGGISSRDPSSLVLFSDEQSPMDILTDDCCNFLADFCS
jgi:hypothetical protein